VALNEAPQPPQVRRIERPYTSPEPASRPDVSRDIVTKTASDTDTTPSPRHTRLSPPSGDKVLQRFRRQLVPSDAAASYRAMRTSGLTRSQQTTNAAKRYEEKASVGVRFLSPGDATRGRNKQPRPLFRRSNGDLVSSRLPGATGHHAALFQPGAHVQCRAKLSMPEYLRQCRGVTPGWRSS